MSIKFTQDQTVYRLSDGRTFTITYTYRNHYDEQCRLWQKVKIDQSMSGDITEHEAQQIADYMIGFRLSSQPVFLEGCVVVKTLNDIQPANTP